MMMNHPYLKRMRDLREDHDKTQREIAELLGTSQTMYARYERGALVKKGGLCGWYAGRLKE